MTPAPETPPVIELFGAAYLRLHSLVNGPEIAESQWKMGATPTARDDTTERSRGMTSDPVPTATFDKRRLELRAAVIEGQRALRDADQAMKRAVAVLERAHGQWPTEPSDRTSGS